MKNITEKDWKDLHDILDTPLNGPEDGDYAEEENGIVTIYRKDGHAIMQMPLEVYEQIMEHDAF